MGPKAGTTSCPVHHVQVFLSGRFAVRMDDGEEVEFGPLDVGDIPPGHDAWVVGDEPVHILDFAGNSDAIGMPREHERMALAGPSEVFASAVTVGLADGSGLAFEGQGQREVKGLDRPIQVYRLV